MALFGKDRERNDRSWARTGADTVAPPTEPAPREVEMFDRTRESGQTQPTGTPATTTTDPSATSAFLGKGSRVTGKLVFEGTVRIEGHVEGEITAQDTLIIGESAIVNAQIVGTSVIVHGRVTGDITAKKRLEIRAPGRLVGNITTPSLVIHEGVVFEGQCSMGGTDAPRGEKDRKVAFLTKDERAADGAAHLAQSEIGK
jgi:cytoskeletal protein CcmA (bactofilin family)